MAATCRYNVPHLEVLLYWLYLCCYFAYKIYILILIPQIMLFSLLGPTRQDTIPQEEIPQPE